MNGQLSLTGSSIVNGITLNSNTSGSQVIKIVGREGISVFRNIDSIFITNVTNPSILVNHQSLTVNDGTLTDVGGSSVEIEEGLNKDFTIYLHYTTGATSQGLQFRITNSGTGTYWYDYNFPTTSDRVTGSIYNANTTVVIPSSETGTNIAIIRGVTKSSAVGAGIFELTLQVSAEDGSSTISVLTTGITKQ